MSKIDMETLFINLEFNIEKAEHMAEKIISNYNLDSPKPDELDDKVFVSNRSNIFLDMEILADYIRLIKSGKDNIAREVMA